MADTATCSRCGATDNRHSAKCLQAMALGWAMGVEERPKLGPVRVERDDDEIAQIGEQYAAPFREEVSRLLAEMDVLGEKLIAAQAEVERLRQERAEWDRPLRERRAEIQAEIESPAFQRELEEMAASEHLEVEVLDEANATVRPARDDDYTEAGVNATDPVGKIADAIYEAVGLPPETPPAPEPAPLPPEAAPAAEAPEPEVPRSTAEWAEYIKALRARTGLSGIKFAKLVGCSAPSARDWELGKFTPGPHWQARLAEIEADLDKGQESAPRASRRRSPTPSARRGRTPRSSARSRTTSGSSSRTWSTAAPRTMRT
jgi:hypothetical protein